jgi:hypothetical protein
MLPAMTGAVLMAVLWWAEYRAHESLNSLIRSGRDDCMIDFMAGAIGSVPWRFWICDYLWTDRNVFLPWALACAFFAAGPLVAFMLSRGKAAHIFSLALLLGVITHGCVNVVSEWAPAMGFGRTLFAFVKLNHPTWPGVAWILRLSLGGAAVGIVLQRIVRAVARRADRRKTPARE